MIPQLPPNYFTIADAEQDSLDVSWLNDRYLRRNNTMVLIENQLDLLRQYDNYFRQTDPAREAVKEVLNAYKRKLIFGL